MIAAVLHSGSKLVIVRAVFFLLLTMTLSPVASGDELQRYVIDVDRSWIRVLVYRAGLMSMFGHNHVIASHEISGAVTCGANVDDTTVEMSFPVRSLLVDSQDLRDLEGEDFSARVSDKNIRGTRKNLFGDKVLDLESHALIQIRSTEVSGDMESLLVKADVIIAGRINSISFPASATLSGDVITVTGTARLDHEDLGLKPFSAAFGTLRVHKDLTIRFEITAVVE